MCSDEDRKNREWERRESKTACDHRRLVNVAVLACAEPATTCQVAAEYVLIAFVNRWTNMVELGDEGVLEPVYEGLRDHDRQNWLCM